MVCFAMIRLLLRRVRDEVHRRTTDQDSKPQRTPRAQRCIYAARSNFFAPFASFAVSLDERPGTALIVSHTIAVKGKNCQWIVDRSHECATSISRSAELIR